jgi:hypothetical protein
VIHHGEDADGDPMIFNTDDCDCGCPPGAHGMTGCLACPCRAAWADLCALPEVRATTRNGAQGEQQQQEDEP